MLRLCVRPWELRGQSLSVIATRAFRNWSSQFISFGLQFLLRIENHRALIIAPPGPPCPPSLRRISKRRLRPHNHYLHYEHHPHSTPAPQHLHTPRAHTPIPSSPHHRAPNTPKRASPTAARTPQAALPRRRLLQVLLSPDTKVLPRRTLHIPTGLLRLDEAGGD